VNVRNHFRLPTHQGDGGVYLLSALAVLGSITSQFIVRAVSFAKAISERVTLSSST